jgi:hypothetical protein
MLSPVAVERNASFVLRYSSLEQYSFINTSPVGLGVSTAFFFLPHDAVNMVRTTANAMIVKFLVFISLCI